MKPISLFAALCSALALGAHVPGLQQPTAPSPGGLQRVDPDEEDLDPNDLKGLFTRAFDPERWRERLRLADLDQRERSLDALLQRARLDPVARAFLEELAANPSAGELAWTARLALRELGRASFSIPGLPLQGFVGPDPFGAAQRMQEFMDEIFRREGFGMVLPHLHKTPTAPGPGGSGRSVRVEQSEQGARVIITEIVDGEVRTLGEYEGKSLEEILDPALNPELAGELDGLSLRVRPGAPLDLRFDLGKRLSRELRRFPRQPEEGPRLAPQGKSRPIRTDRLGVIVQPVGAARARELGLEGRGLLVERAYPETYAHLLGVKAGDVLLELDGIELHSAADIERAMGARGPDQELTLVWLDELEQRQEKTWQPSPEAGKR
jgi:hypothetical protein